MNRAALALLLGLAGCTRQEGPPEEHRGLSLTAVERSPLAVGLDLLTAEVRRASGQVGRLTLLVARPAAVELELQTNPERRSLLELADGALAIANAGYFTKDWRPTGLLHTQGRTLNPLIKEGGAAGSGVMVVEGDEVRLVRREQLAATDLERAHFALQAGPRIIEPDGLPGIRSDDGARANRTVLGRTRDGRLALAVIYGEDAGVGTGPTLYELQALLGPDGLGSIDPQLALNMALNLDGGPSTGLHLSHPTRALHFPEGGAVYSALRYRARP